MKFSNIIKLNLAAVVAAGLFSLTSCSDDYDGLKMWGTLEEPGTNDIPVLKPRYIWVDAASNFPDFCDSRDNIIRDLTLAKNAGFTDIVVDVRTTTGDILFKSSHCDEIRSMNSWVKGQGYITTYRTATWDYLQAFIDEGHKLGLKIHAGFNTMTGGHATGGPNSTPAGILYRDASKKEWANYHCVDVNGKATATNVMDLYDSDSKEKFFNPGNPEVVAYLCDLLTDLAKYDIDGIVLDRGRYNDLRADFSPLSRQQFEKYIGSVVPNWPGDILPEGSTNAVLGDNYTDYTKLWLEYRAKTIYEFMENARAAVKAVNPDLTFGVYVGGWYNSYYNTGVNWASKNYAASKNHKWASDGFRNYGYAALMDHILIGAYANPTAVKGSNEWSMEGFCLQAKAKIGNDCPLVVGGPDVDWVWEGSSAVYTKDQILSAIENSVDACINACDGYFLFDMVHLKLDPEKWDAVSKGNNAYVDNWNEEYGNDAE